MLNKITPYINMNLCRRNILLSIFLVALSACSNLPEKVQPTDVPLNAETKKIYQDAVSNIKSGNTKQAQLLLAKVIQQQPGFAGAHINLGILYLKMEMNKKAEIAFQKALSLEPRNKYALNQQAYLYRINGEFNKAKNNYQQAIDIDPGYANAYLNLGILYDLYLYDLGKAIEQYKKYDDLTKGSNKQVNKWIFDLERRYKQALSQK